MKTVKEFCDNHDACSDGRAWALTLCEDMNEVWQTAKTEWLVWIATREGVLTDVELRRFAVWASRQVQRLMTDDRSLNALDVAERHVNGAATDEELAAAHADARAAAYAADAAYAAYAAAYTDAARAATSATHAAARAAADAAAHAAHAAADDAARFAARAAARAASYTAWSDARAAQAQWLRDNTKPNFA